MNRTWIRRALGAGVLAGGMLLLGTGSATAGVPVTGEAPAAQPASPQDNVVRPVLDRPDEAIGLVTRNLPLPTGTGAVFDEAGGSVPGVSQAPGQKPTNGMQVDGSDLLSTVGGLTQGLTGPAASPLAGLTGGGEGTVVPIPLNAPGQMVPLSAIGTEEGPAGGMQAPGIVGDDLLDQIGSQAGLVIDALASGGGVAHTLPAPAGESTREDSLTDATSGVSVAGMPLGSVTSPVNDLAGSVGSEGGTSTVAPDQQPGAPSVPQTGANPLGPVTGILGGLA